MKTIKKSSTQLDKLDITDNANSTLIDYHPVENTPFTVIEDKQDEITKFRLVMGKYLIMDNLESVETGKEEAITIDWWKIMSIISSMINEQKEQLKNN